MPPLTDQEGQQDSFLNLDPVFQEGSAARRRSPKAKKKKRKDPSPPGEDEATAGKGGSEGATVLEKKLYVQRHPESPPLLDAKRIFGMSSILIHFFFQDTTPYEHSSTTTQDCTVHTSTTRHVGASRTTQQPPSRTPRGL